MKPLTVLAWDTATECLAAALLRWREGEVEVLADYAGQAAPHSQVLPPQLARMLETNGLKPGRVDLFVVGRGPGSFTGLRTGLALAKGLALGSGRPVLGIGTLEVLAAQILAAESDSQALAAPVIDARHREVFTALYGRDGPLWPPQALPPEDFASALSAAAGGRPVVVDGPARPLVQAALPGTNFRAGAERPRSVSAAVLAGLGAKIFKIEPEAERLHPPLPLYIRPPDLRPAAIF